MRLCTSLLVPLTHPHSFHIKLHIAIYCLRRLELLQGWALPLLRRLGGMYIQTKGVPDSGKWLACVLPMSFPSHFFILYTFPQIATLPFGTCWTFLFFFLPCLGFYRGLSGSSHISFFPRLHSEEKDILG